MSKELIDIIATAVLTPVLTAVGAFLVIVLKAGAAEVKARTSNEHLRRYLTLAEEAVTTAVLSVQQTVVASVKGTDGWTEDKMKEAFLEAKMKAVVIMGAEVQAALKEVYPDFEAWLDNKIESCIGKMK